MAWAELTSEERAARRERIKATALPALEGAIARYENAGEHRTARSLRWALDELCNHDNPEPWRALSRLLRMPVTVQEFCESTEFVGCMDDFRVWPEWRKELRKLNPDVFCGEHPVEEVVLGGASGTGKTTIAQLTMAYQMYLLTCFDSPHVPFTSMSSLNPIMFPLFSLKPSITREVLYRPLRLLLTSMPYFKKYSDWDKYRDAELHLHKGKIQLTPMIAMDTSMQGQAVCGSIMDEMAFMQVIQQSTQVPGPRGQGGKFDQAQILYSQAVNRRNRSCKTRGVNVGCLFVMSNTRYQGDFMDRKLSDLEAHKRRGVYFRRLMRHKVNPDDIEDVRKGDTVRVLVGAPGYSSRVLKDDEVPGDDYPAGADVVVVPAKYLNQFLDDPDGGLREVCGISTGVITPFIPRREKIADAFARGAGLYKWVDEQNVRLDVHGMPRWVPKNLPERERDVPRFVHVDLSISKDRCGVAIARIAGGQYVPGRDDPDTQELAPHVVVELAVSIRPTGTHQVDPGEVRSWLMTLPASHGIVIGAVSYDGFQSHESMQRWFRAGVRTKEVSVDRTSEPYMEMRHAMYQDRLTLVGNDVLYDELLELEYNEKKDIIDHPPKGSKDLADAVAGAVWMAQNSRDVRAWASYVDQRTGEVLRARPAFGPRRKGGRHEVRRHGSRHGRV